MSYPTPESWRFIAVNDLHYREDACRPWFDQIVATMKQDAPDAKFCLLVGDLSDEGKPAQLHAVKDAFAALDIPVYVTIGNHDCLTDEDSSAFDRVFPEQRNQFFEMNGWQFLGLDTVDGTRWQNTKIQPSTFEWLEKTLPGLSRTKPTVIWTHFPLGEGAHYPPINSDELLEKFLDFNIQAVLNGHWHALTEREWHSAKVTTNRCCSRFRDNHDGTKEKGWFVCEINGGTIKRRFVQIPELLRV